MGAVLPLPRNEQENDDLLAVWNTYTSTVYMNRHSLALGMDYITNERQWRDWSGNEVTFFNWHSYYAKLSMQNHAVMFGRPYIDHGIDGEWYGWSGNPKVAVLCQLSNCSIDDIVLECSPTNIALSVPKCFLDDKEIDSSEVYIGQNTASGDGESSGDGDACQG